MTSSKQLNSNQRKNLIIVLIAIIVSLAMCSRCNSKGTSSQDSTSSTYLSSKNEWYVGGDLHKKNIIDWKNASYNNQLATCGDFLAKFNQNSSMSEIKYKAEQLVNCINGAVEDHTVVDKSPVADIAASCIILMGYNK